VLAASVWGESDDTGKPTAVRNVSLLIYYQDWQKKCEKMPRNPYHHCLLSPRGSELVFDCKVGQEPWQRAKRIVRKGSNGQPFWSTDPEISTDTLYCGVESGADASMLQDRRPLPFPPPSSHPDRHASVHDICFSTFTPLFPLLCASAPNSLDCPTATSILISSSCTFSLFDTHP
jgi:hypothetical protein